MDWDLARRRCRRATRGGVAAALLLIASSCATTPERAALGELVVRDTAGATIFKGAATYTVRQPERAVGVKGLGEILVDDNGCRFAWSKDGLDQLVLLDHASDKQCADLSASGRLCFASARFVSADGRAPGALVVDGCADENDLLWSKVEGPRLATVGPTAFRSRCRRLPRAKKGCDVTYLQLTDIAVDSNATPRDGFSFLWDGEGWRACFLEKDAGPYRMKLVVEDACDKRGPITLEGHSSELDD